MQEDVLKTSGSLKEPKLHDLSGPITIRRVSRVCTFAWHMYVWLYLCIHTYIYIYIFTHTHKQHMWISVRSYVHASVMQIPELYTHQARQAANIKASLGEAAPRAVRTYVHTCMLCAV